MEILDQQSRPWQGTLLGVVSIVGLVMAGVMILLIMLGSSFISGMADDPVFSFIFGAGAFMIILLVVPFIVLGVFVTIGMFKGQKWAVIIMLIFTAIALLSALSGSFMGDGGGYGHSGLGSIVINGFLLYCEIASLKDPFYK